MRRTQPPPRAWSGCAGWGGRVFLGLFVSSLILSGLAFLAGSRAQAALKAKHPPIGRMVDIGGYRLHLYCEGEGEPAVILDAPLLAPGLMWANIQSQVAETTRVCSYDRAGIGWSDPSPLPRSVAVIVEELHSLLENSGIPGPYVLVGYSSSGLANRLYAHTYPAEVAGLVMADPAHEDQAERLGAQGSPWMKNFFRLGPALIRTRIPALFSWLFPVPVGNQLPPEAQQAFQALVVSDPKYAETAYSELDLIEESWSEVRAAQITNLGDIPLVVLAHGRMASIPGVSLSPEAEAIWQQMQREQAALSTKGRYVVVEDSSHDIPSERPDLLVGAIREVVSEVRQQAQAEGQ